MLSPSRSSAPCWPWSTRAALTAEPFTLSTGGCVVPALSLPTGAGDHGARPLDPPTPRRLGLAVRSLAGAAPAARAFLGLDAAGQAPGRGEPAPQRDGRSRAVRSAMTGRRRDRWPAKASPKRVF